MLCFRVSSLIGVMCIVAALSGGCRFGEARFDSTVEGLTFEPGGTVFSYTDARDGALTLDNNPRVVVMMTWAMFDPRSDLNEKTGRELADVQHEVALRDALALVFDRVSDLEPNATFSSTTIGGVEQSPGRMSARVHIAPELLDPSSTYADVVPLASLRTTTVVITDNEIDSDDAALAADVTIRFERQDTDAGNARVGEWRGRFMAPVVEERLAEHNLALLDVAGLVGLPLGPRLAEESP